MNSNSIFQRGSEWRKWDLHIHSPFTTLNNQYELDQSFEFKSSTETDKKWEYFFSKLDEFDLSIIAITDYFSINNFAQAMEKHKIFSSEVKCLLPNIEFRIAQENKDSEFIHIHVIFSSSEDTVDKIDNFLTRLPLISTDDKSLKNKYCTTQDIQEIGIEKVLITADKLKEILNNDFNEIDEYLIMGVARGYGNIRPGQNDDGRGAEYAKELDKLCHAFFGNAEDVNFYLNKIQGRSQYNLSPKAVIQCSDAHDYDSIGKNFTWIKADPTFEGFKQIIYEPEERVKIQDDNPKFIYNKAYFDSINISSELQIFENIIEENQQVYFESNSILLNSGLVTIIGGRGEGKSLLINYLSNLFDKLTNESEDEFSSNSDFKVNYAKNSVIDPDIVEYSGDENNELEFLFISQNKIKNIADKRMIGKEIKKLLDLENLLFDDNITNTIKTVRKNLDDLKDWFSEKDEDGDSYHNENFINEFMQKYNRLIESIKTSENKEKLEKYTSNIEEINQYEDLKIRLEKLIEELNTNEVKYNQEIEELNNIIPQNGQIPKIKFKPQIDILNADLNIFQVEVDKKVKENTEIKNEFESEGFSGDLTTLLSNAEKYQGNVNWANARLVEIKKKNKEYEIILKQRNSLGDLIKSEYERQRDIITEAWENIIEKIEIPEHKSLMQEILTDRNIEIKGEIVFDSRIFYQKLLMKS